MKTSRPKTLRFIIIKPENIRPKSKTKNCKSQKYKTQVRLLFIYKHQLSVVFWKVEKHKAQRGALEHHRPQGMFRLIILIYSRKRNPIWLPRASQCIVNNATAMLRLLSLFPFSELRVRGPAGRSSFLRGPSYPHFLFFHCTSHRPSSGSQRVHEEEVAKKERQKGVLCSFLGPQSNVLIQQISKPRIKIFRR